jgi:hypothetical protein
MYFVSNHKKYMYSIKIPLGAISIVLCLFIYQKGYCQVTTPAQWERARKEREANDASKRQEQKIQEQQYKTNANSNTQNTGPSKPVEVYSEISKTADVNGLRKVRSSTVYGLIDKSGKEIVAPIYKDIGDYSGIFYRVSSNKPGTDYDKVWGFIDNNGIKIIPLKFDLVLRDFKNGTALVVLNNEKFLINESGAIVGEKSVYIKEKSALEIQEMDVNYKIRSDKNFELAQKSEAEGKFREAADLYQTSLSYSKEPYSSWYNELNLRIAICLISGPSFGLVSDRWGNGADVREACGYICKYATQEGKNPKQFYYMGYILTNELGSLPNYIESIKKVYGHADALSFFKQYEAKETVAELKKSNVYEMLGDGYWATRDTVNALKYYQKQEIKVDSLTLNRGLIYKNMELLLASKDFEMAIIYMNGINNFPAETTTCYYLVSNAYAKNGDFKTALRYIDTAIIINSLNQLPVQLHFNETRGYIYYHLAKYTEAMVEFNTVINGGRNEIVSRFFRGKLYDMQGKKMEACSDWYTASNLRLNDNRFITQKDIDDAFDTCSKKIRKSLQD